jgi:adenylate cyclase
LELNPNVIQLAQIYFDARRYQDAVGTLEGLHGLETIWIYLYLAASHAALGQAGEARRVIEQALKCDPRATIRQWITNEKAPYKDPKDRQHLRENLRKAGLPE